MSIPEVRNNPSKVQLTRLGHIYYEHPDPQAFEKFAADFGFVVAARKGDTIYFRGYGRDPYIYVCSKSRTGKPGFGGPAFVARDEKEFNKAAALKGAVKKSLGEAPGGGQMVTIARPNGTFMHVVHGQEERRVDESRGGEPTATHRSQGPYNTSFDKPRQGKFQRYREGPALVHKLGHFGYSCVEFDAELAFYTANFNFVHSDILWDPARPNVDIITFMHLDLGAGYSDHHVLFLQRAPPDVGKTYVHHSSYEVADFDTQLLGHEWLARKGWTSIWGVGRHIQGSQIFDYWMDSSGFNLEHYCDGDVVNETHKLRREAAGALSVWGPELPSDFFDDKTTPAKPRL